MTSEDPLEPECWWCEEPLNPHTAITIEVHKLVTSFFALIHPECQFKQAKEADESQKTPRLE